MGRKSAFMISVIAVLSGCTFVIHPPGEFEERARHEAAGQAIGYYSERPAPDITTRALLPDVIHYAERCNGELQAAYHEWRAALERVPQAGALDNPKLMIGYEFAFDPFNRAKPASSSGSMGGGMGGGGGSMSGGEEMDKWTIDRAILGFSQMVPASGKRETRAERALFEAMAAAERFRDTHFSIRSRVVAAYGELLYTQLLTDLENENLELLRTIYSIGEHQLHAGVLQQVELARLDVEILRAESILVATEIERDRRLAELNALLNRHPQAKVGKLGTRGLALRTESLPKLLETACHNPQLAELQKQIEARGASVVLADLEHLPDFEFSLSDIRTMSQMVMLGLTLPINKERIDAGVRESVATRDAVIARMRNQETNALSRIVVAFAMLKDARRILTDFEGRIAQRTEDVLSLQEEYYGAGTGDFLATLDTQRTLLDLRRLIARARADEIRAMGEIESVAGVNLLTFRRGRITDDDFATSSSAAETVDTDGGSGPADAEDVVPLDDPLSSPLLQELAPISVPSDSGHIHETVSAVELETPAESSIQHKVVVTQVFEPARRLEALNSSLTNTRNESETVDSKFKE